MTPPDLIVVGGGCVGASVAYHLASAGAGSVLLLERADALGTGSTAAAAGGFRHQFSSEVNVRLSQASTPMIVGFEEQHGLPLDVHQDGYLFLVRDEATRASFERDVEMQRRLGVRVEVLTGDQAAELIPGLAVDDVLMATFGPDDGIADPSGLTQGYGTLARRAGAELRTGVEVTALLSVGGRVTGVETAEGPMEASAVVVAAGAWSGELVATAGLELPIDPIPRNVAVTAAFPGVPERRTLVVDTGTGFYFHREGPGVLMGIGSPDERPSFDTRVDETLIAERLLPRAVEVLPPLEAAGLAHTWCGLYEMTPDRHPVIDRPIEGLYVAAGFSGHGFQHAPIAGKLIAEMVVDGEARSVDVGALSLNRFSRGELIGETRFI